MTNRSWLGVLAGLGLTLVACDMSPRGPKEAEVGVAGDQRRVDARTPARGFELQEEHQTIAPPMGGEAVRRPPAPGAAAGGAAMTTSWPAWGSTGRLPPADDPNGTARPR
jgi:hypothetical protein